MHESPHYSRAFFVGLYPLVIEVTSRLKRRLERTKVILEPCPDEESRDFDFDPHLETGFQLATFQGPLCAEPVEGMAYFVEDLQIDMAGIEKEVGKFVIFTLARFVGMLILHSAEQDGDCDRIDNYSCT